MRKLKHIGDYLVVKFNSREMEEWGTTLGEYGVIDKELYTGNLDVDKGVLEFDGIESLEEAIEQAKSLAFPEEPEQTTTPPASIRPHFPQIGEVLPNGHTVDAAYCVGKDRYVLAHQDGAPEPYAVWDVDQGSDTVNGKYFVDQIRAQNYFADIISNHLERESRQIVHESQEDYKNEQCVKETMFDVYTAIFRYFKGSSARKEFTHFLYTTGAEIFYQTPQLRRGHLDAQSRLSPAIKQGQL